MLIYKDDRFKNSKNILYIILGFHRIYGELCVEISSFKFALGNIEQ